MNIYSFKSNILTILYSNLWSNLPGHKSQLGICFSQMNFFEKYSNDSSGSVEKFAKGCRSTLVWSRPHLVYKYYFILQGFYCKVRFLSLSIMQPHISDNMALELDRKNTNCTINNLHKTHHHHDGKMLKQHHPSNTPVLLAS